MTTTTNAFGLITTLLLTLAGSSCGNGGSEDDAGVIDAIGPSNHLLPSDLSYQGAFRLPDEFNWGARGISFYPPGDNDSGSLLITGFELTQDLTGTDCWEPTANCVALFGQVAIPTLATEANWEALPVAALLGPIAGFDGGLVAGLHPEYNWVSDIEWVPRSGTQFTDKLYGSLNLWYPEGVMGEDTFPTLWFAELDGSNPRGLFHVGPEESPFHGRKVGDYLFTVPSWYGNEYFGGRTLLAGAAASSPLRSSERATALPSSRVGLSAGPARRMSHLFNPNEPSGGAEVTQ